MQYSKYQEEIFKTASGSGHVAIEAVAGSGKSTTLIELAKRLGKDALFCAFNKHIATELGWKLPQGCTAKTIHSLGFAGLSKRISGRIQVDTNKYIDLVKTEAVMSFGAHQSEADPDVEWLAKVGDLNDTLASLTRLAQSTLTSPEDERAMEDIATHYGVDLTDWQFPYLCRSVAKILEKGQEVAASKNVIGYEDMIWLPSVWNLQLKKSSAVLVDEAQDLSAAQLEIVMRSVAKDGRVWAVGDSFQSIMGFAGADLESFSKLKSRLNSTELPLSVCYRCPTSHLDLARSLVPHIEASPGAKVGTIESISGEDRLLESLQYGDRVLCRKTSPLVKLALMAISQRKPAKVAGRDIGKSITQTAERVARMEGFRFSLWASYRRRLVEMEQVRLENDPRADKKMGNLCDRLEAIDAVIEAYPEIDSIKSLCAAIESLFDDGSAITLSTIHRAKGLEAERVFVLQNHLPLIWENQKDWEYQQELNLKYVALTRSSDYLGLVQLSDRF